MKESAAVRLFASLVFLVERKYGLIFFIFTLAVFPSYAQSYLLGDGGAVMNNICAGILLDPGGFDDYPGDQDVTQTFCASPGKCIQFTITEFETEKDYDVLSIYDGTSTSAELLFKHAGENPPNTVITSTSASGGCLTFNFKSDDYFNFKGFKGTFSCVSCPISPDVMVLGQGGSSKQTCNAILRDPGGSGNYADNTNIQQTICSDDASKCVQVSFVEFDTERGKDFLKIYDGSNTFSPLLAELSGSIIPQPLISSSNSGGCLTFVFTSNQTYTRPGFKAIVSCAPCKPPVKEYVIGQSGRITACDGVILDPGGNSAIPPDQHVQQTFCSGTGQCLQLEFTSFDLEKDMDVIKVFDGPDNFSEQIAEYSGQDIPPVITGSTNSGGCLTVAFLSNSSGYNDGFSAKIKCVPCIPPPQNVVMGRSAATIVSCGGSLLDPGGYGYYDDNQNVVQTICSGSNQCVKLTFTDFNTETSVDLLRIYDGPTVDPTTLLGVFSGINKPLPVESSVQSGGCLTLQFSSNGSVTKSGFSAIITCNTCVDPYPIPTGKCKDARGFCTDDGTIDFPAGTNVDSPFGSGNAGRIGCLGSTPNPAWYYMNVSRSGPININIMGSEDGGINATNDVDFICWGPFASREEICNLANDRAYSDNPANIIDCSYSPDPVEACKIANAIVGEWYMLLLTNYSNRPSNIYFRQSNSGDAGSGQTNCALFCNIGINVQPSSCDPQTNTYTLSGELEIINPPAGGSLIVTNSSGGILSIPAPFSNPVPFRFDNLGSDGSVNQVTAYFSDNQTCSSSGSYTAPASCSVCPVSITQSGQTCTGSSFSLSASIDAAATYSWTGPNGFSSNSRVLNFSNVDLSMSGLYVVTLNNTSLNCQSKASLNIQVFQTPQTPVVSVNNPVCEGSPINFSTQTASVSGASYQWTGPGGFSVRLQNPSISSAQNSHSGQYSCVISANGCSSASALVNVVVNPYPASPVPANDGPHCAGENLKLSVNNVPGAVYEWQGPLDYESHVQNPVVSNTTVSNSGLYRVRVGLNGCFSRYVTTDAVVYPKPPKPLVLSASPYCSGDMATLTGPESNSGASVVYEWKGPSGFTSSSKSVSLPSIAVSNQGDYTLTVSENGCKSDPNTVSIVVKPRPLADAGPDITVCSGEAAQLGTSPISGLTYTWYPSAGLSSTSIANPEFRMTNSSTTIKQEVYTLSVEQDGCIAEDKVQVTVPAHPMASFHTPNNQCFEGNSFSFSANGTFSSQATFNWNFGSWANPVTSTQRNPTGIHFGSSGVHSVEFQVNDLGCMSNVYKADITVTPMPVSNFDADILLGCAPQSIKFTNLSTSVRPVKTWLWDFGNGRAFSQENPSPVFYDKAGQYTVSLKVTTEDGCEDTYTVPGMIRIYPTPKAQFALIPKSTDIVNPKIEIDDLSKGANSWSYKIDKIDSIVKREFSYVFKDTGVFVIKQYVSNAEGCSSYFEQKVYISLGYRVYIPSAFTPNDDGKNDYFRIYGEGILDAKIEIFDRWGELVYRSFDYENGWDGKMRLGNKSVPGGIYYYRIAVQDKTGVHWNYQGKVTVLK